MLKWVQIVVNLPHAFRVSYFLRDKKCSTKKIKVSIRITNIFNLYWLKKFNLNSRIDKIIIIPNFCFVLWTIYMKTCVEKIGFWSYLKKNQVYDFTTCFIHCYSCATVTQRKISFESLISLQYSLIISKFYMRNWLIQRHN